MTPPQDHDGGHAMPDHGTDGHAATGHDTGQGMEHDAAMVVSGDQFAQTNTSVSAAANASLRLIDNWLVTLGAGRAVRNPSVLERYADRFPAVKFQTAAEFVGNPHLVPEKSLEYNAGTTLRAGQAAITLDVFLRNVADYITVAHDPNVAKRLPLSPDQVFRYVQDLMLGAEVNAGLTLRAGCAEPDRCLLRQPPQLVQSVHAAADCGARPERVHWSGIRVLEVPGEDPMLKMKTVGWCFVLVVASIAIAAAHMAVQKTMPEADAVLSESPHHIQIWFTQAPDPAISRLTLEGAGGEVTLADTTVRDDKSLMAMLPSQLQAGAYTVKWRTAGDDGHTQRGDFAFTVRAAD